MRASTLLASKLFPSLTACRSNATNACRSSGSNPSSLFAQEIRDAKEAIERVIAVLRSAGHPVPIELSEVAKALSRELRPKALRLQRLH